MCLLPVLAESVVVIDEVHSFDSSMFSALDRFLSDFQIPALCMTATLPKDRLRILTEVRKLTPFPGHPDEFPDLATESEAPRYEVQTADGSDAASLAIAA